MFGYVHTNSEELTPENKITYQAYYCGLCRKLKEKYGRKAQLLLNYDMTFMIILLSGLYEPVNNHGTYNCMRHPAEKQNVWINEITDYAADMNVLLSYYNFLDDIKDESSPMKKGMVKSLNNAYKEIAAKYPRQYEAIKTYIEKLDECELKDEKNVDLVSGLTGEMLAEIFKIRDDEWAKELSVIGFYLGKFIYLMDAYEDEVEDYKHKRYNVLSQFRGNGDYEIYCRQLLTCMMSEVAKSFERLPIIQHADILRNVIYSGVWTRYELIQLKLEKKQKNKKN